MRVEIDYSKEEPLTPMRAIRKKCLSCCETANEVKECTVTACPLWPLRAGKSPRRKGRTLTDEQRAAAAERLARARNSRNAQNEGGGERSADETARMCGRQV